MRGRRLAVITQEAIIRVVLALITITIIVPADMDAASALEGCFAKNTMAHLAALSEIFSSLCG